MAELRPYPFAALIRRLFSDLSAGEGGFDLPVRKWFTDPKGRDVGVRFHGHRAASPLGPAAGPQTQMAQNLVLSYLCGCRIMELKTVQINDRLAIPRPCIDMQTVGYNVEWSQELRLQESLEEYVKGAMLIEMLLASDEFEVAEGFADYVFDMSVGYDLAGIQSAGVQSFLSGMMDCSGIVDRLRREIPEELKRFRDLDYRTCLSDTLTLSTFHGCPPDEIEKIMSYLLTDKGLHAIVKLNPTLLGPERVRELIGSRMGYEDVKIPDAAFENDTKKQQAIDFVGRLGELAEREARGFGVKFSNTLLVDNHRDFFPPEERSMYLSGPPLHVLAMNLVGEFREEFGDRFPISFSAGIDRNNFVDAVALGLTPITVCSDLLKPGGYGRASGYHDVLLRKMDAVGATCIDDFVIRAYGLGEASLSELSMTGEERARCTEALASGAPLREAAGEHYAAWVSAARLANTRHYVDACTADERYGLVKNSRLPKKVGSHLELLDCVSCNKCIPVCPNDANFSFAIPVQEQAVVKLWEEDGIWKAREEGQIEVSRKVQYGNFADFCNECGNCDIFCPEDGGPYRVKARFFGRLDDWREFASLDGFCFEGHTIHARYSGQDYLVVEEGNRIRYEGPAFSVTFEAARPAESVTGRAEGEVDLSFYHLSTWIRDAVFADSSRNYLRFLAS